jgi:hypothetical protein
VLSGIFCPHGRLSRFNELPRFLNKPFGAFADLLPGFFVWLCWHWVSRWEFMTQAFRRLIIAESPLQAKRKLSTPVTFPVTPNTQQEVIAGRQPIMTDDPAEHPLQRLHQFATSVLCLWGRFRLPLHDYLPQNLAATFRSTPSTVFSSSDSRSQSVIASSQSFRSAREN